MLASEIHLVQAYLLYQLSSDEAICAYVICSHIILCLGFFVIPFLKLQHMFSLLTVEFPRSSMLGYLQFDFACLRHCLWEAQRTLSSDWSVLWYGGVAFRGGQSKHLICDISCKSWGSLSLTKVLIWFNEPEMSGNWSTFADFCWLLVCVSEVDSLLMYSPFSSLWSLSHFMESSLMDMLDIACHVQNIWLSA